MIRTLLSFIKTHKYAAIWTISYLFIMWAILYNMFNFDMLNGAQWHRLMHAQLRGFGGFVFGIMLLAAIPLYVATTTIIIRTKKPLITIPLPKIRFKKKSAEKTAESEKTPETENSEPKQTETISKDIPPEIRATFLRAQKHIEKTVTKITPNQEIEHTPVPVSATIHPITQNIPTPNAAMAEIPPIEDFETDTFPLPDDFDIDTPSGDSIPVFGNVPLFTDTPTFSEINFEETPASNHANPNNDIVREHLEANNIEYTEIDNIIQTEKFAIISHIDNGFWVADSDNWFATGKSIPSPIKTVQEFASTNNLTPVIYLGATNILDLDKNISEWESNGITVITNINDIK